MYKVKGFNPLKSKGALKRILKDLLREFCPYDHPLDSILLKPFYMQSPSI